jgi:uncharacterized protein (TIGR01244 family)
MLISLPGVAVVSLLLQATPPAAPPQPKPETLEGARNYTRVDATVACGGVTTPEAFAELKRRGFTSVINLRTADEPDANLEEEAAALKKVGLKNIHIPFNADKPDTAAVDAFLKAVADTSNQPVYIHCGSANRVGMMWLVKRVMIDNFSFPQAAQEAQGIGLRSRPLMEFAYQYIKAHGR